MALIMEERERARLKGVSPARASPGQPGPEQTQPRRPLPCKRAEKIGGGKVGLL